MKMTHAIVSPAGHGKSPDFMLNPMSGKKKHELENFFGMLSYIRNHEYQPPPLTIKPKRSLKHILASLLYPVSRLTIPGPAINGGGQNMSADIADSQHRAYPGGMSTMTTLPPGESHVHAGHDKYTQDTLTPHRQRHSKHKAQLKGPARHDALSLERQNKQLYALLLDHALISPLAGDSLCALINGATALLESHADGLNLLSRKLLQGSGLYGASQDEWLTENAQQKVLGDWLASNVFGMSIEEFVALEMNREDSVETENRVDHRFRVHVMRSIIFNKMKTFAAGTEPAEEKNGILNPAAMSVIERRVISPAMPTFFYGGGPFLADNMWIGSRNWCYLHIGLRFVLENGIEITDLSKQDIIDVGISLEAMLMERMLTPSLMRFFIVPALFLYLQRKTDKTKPDISDFFHSTVIRQRAVQFFLHDYEQRINKIVPYAEYQTAVKEYKTRTQLAQYLLQQECQSLSAEECVSQAENYKNNPDSFYCNAVAGTEKKPYILLPHLNEKFTAQIATLTDKFSDVDKILLGEAFKNLTNEEILFLNSAEIKKADADFSVLEYFTGLPAEYFYGGVDRPVRLSPDCEILAATLLNEERLYILRQEKAGYRLINVGRRPENYYEFMQPKLRVGDKNHRLNIYLNGQSRIIKPAEQSLDIVFDTLAVLHKIRLRTLLQHYGYDETGLEKFKKILLSLIPFYDCINDIMAKRDEAVLSCALDLLSLVPLAGQAGAIANRIATKIGFSSAMALQMGLSTYAAKASLKIALKTGGRYLVTHALLPAAAELNQRAFISLALGLARAVDPGLETLARVGKASVLQFAFAAKFMKEKMPVMQKMLPRLEKSLMRQKIADPPTHYATGRLPGYDVDIPIQRLGGDGYLGQDVYVRLNPDTGDCFGRKYTLLPDRSLVAVPLPMAKRLHNILQQGLSGRGAGRAGLLWAGQQSHDELLAVRLGKNKEECVVHLSRYGEAGSEQLLFPEYGIDLHQEPLDMAQYALAFNALSPDEKLALRMWTLIDGETTQYSDGSPNLSLLGIKSLNTEINVNLRSKIPVAYWGNIEKRVYQTLLNALDRKLPTHKGSFLRVAEYRNKQIIPWASTIAPGDIVTNYPLLMSVSSQDTYAKEFTIRTHEEAAAGDTSVNALIYYKIENAEQCIPLLANIASTVEHEKEYLYPPKVFFKVKSISTGYLVNGDIQPATRVAVVLEELPEPAASAMNLFTGELLKFDQPGDV